MSCREGGGEFQTEVGHFLFFRINETQEVRIIVFFHSSFLFSGNADKGNWSLGGATSQQFSARDLPGHKVLKYVLCILKMLDLLEGVCINHDFYHIKHIKFKGLVRLDRRPKMSCSAKTWKRSCDEGKKRPLLRRCSFPSLWAILLPSSFNKTHAFKFC